MLEVNITSTISSASSCTVGNSAWVGVVGQVVGRHRLHGRRTSILHVSLAKVKALTFRSLASRLGLVLESVHACAQSGNNLDQFQDQPHLAGDRAFDRSA